MFKRSISVIAVFALGIAAIAAGEKEVPIGWLSRSNFERHSHPATKPSDDEMQLLVGRVLAFPLPVDLFFSAQAVKSGKPDISNVRPRQSFIIGNDGYLTFVSSDKQQRQWLVRLDDIVATRYMLAMPSGKNINDEQMNDAREIQRQIMHEGERSEQDDWENWAELGDAVQGMFWAPTELYLQHEDVTAKAPTFVSSDANGYYILYRVPFVRFRPMDYKSKERWVINTHHLVAARLVNEMAPTSDRGTIEPIVIPALPTQPSK
jgi:hypothetical protein